MIINVNALYRQSTEDIPRQLLSVVEELFGDYLAYVQDNLRKCGHEVEIEYGPSIEPYSSDYEEESISIENLDQFWSWYAKEIR